MDKTVVRAGTGPMALNGQKVTVHVTGYGKDGDLSKKFVSTRDQRMRPLSFIVGERSVIRGLDVGVLGMRVEEIARFECISDYANGKRGFPPYGILPNQNVVFEVELLAIQTYQN